MGATTSGYFAASYFFHICIKEGRTLFFFAGGWYPWGENEQKLKTQNKQQMARSAYRKIGQTADL